MGICYGVQTDKSALLSYGDVLKVEKVDSVMYLDLTELESATTYSYVAYAKYENASVADVHSVVRSFTTQSADLYLTPSRLNRSATGRLDTVKITTTFDFWAVAEYDYDWITYEKKDTLLILKTQDNSGAEIRSAILKIQAGSRTQSLAVMQAAPTISLSADTLEVSAKGATGSFIVRSDVAWSIDKDADWVTCSVEKDSIVNFTAEVNTGSEERFGHITVSVSDQLYKIFTVAQRSGALAVTKTNLSYGLKGGEEGFVVECNTDDWTFSSDKSWCKPEWIQGTDSIAVRVDPNDTEAAVRTATITVQKEQSVKKVTVSQESGLMLSDVSLENLVFWGGNGDIKVKAYTDSWTVESVTDDFTASRTNDSIVTVSVANLNTTAQEITGSVTIKAGNLTQTMTLVQPCAVIDWGTEEVKFSYTGGTKSNTSGNYIGMTKYKVEGTGVSWLTVGSEGVSFVQGTDGYMVVAGEDDAFVTLNLTATANNTGKTRTATITGVWEGVTESFTVTQMDASSVVVLPALEAGVLAGNYTLTEEGYTGYVHFGDKIYTKAEYDEITTELEAAGTSLYDDRYAKFRPLHGAAHLFQNFQHRRIEHGRASGEFHPPSGSSGGAGQCGGEDAVRQGRKIAARKRPPPLDVDRRSPRALDTPAAAVQEVGKVGDLRLPRRAPQDGGASGADSGQQQCLRRPHAGEAEGEVCPVESPWRGQHQPSRPGVQLLCPHPGQTFQM